MSFLVADAFTARGRVFNLAEVEWATGELPAGCGLFEASDVTRFAAEHPGAIDVAALPVRPPLDSAWIESVFPRFEHPMAGGDAEMLTYDRLGALVTCGDADDDGRRWVHIDGYALCSQLPVGVQLVDARPEIMPGVVHRLPFEGGYEIDERGMVVHREGGVSVAVYPRRVFDGADTDPRCVSAEASLAESAATITDLERKIEGVELGVEEEAELDELRRRHAEGTRHLDETRARLDASRADLLGLFDSGWRPTFEVLTTVVTQAVAAMNVRNTVREPMRASRQVRRARERSGLVDPAKVTVLKVPGAQRVAADAVGVGGGVDRPHHPVLGHFAYYGDTHPDGQPRGLLFGRQEGVFWHPPHWRGNRELGERSHTYRVIAPSAEQ